LYSKLKGPEGIHNKGDEACWSTKNEHLIAAVLHNDSQTIVLRMEAYNSLQGKEWLHGEVNLKSAFVVVSGSEVI